MTTKRATAHIGEKFSGKGENMYKKEDKKTTPAECYIYSDAIKKDPPTAA